MRKGTRGFLPALAVGLATVLMVGCGTTGGGGSLTTTAAQPGTLVTFGTDAPICDVASFVVTITSASLVPSSGGTPVTVISGTAPAIVDFGRLTDFTTILGTASVAAGTYSQLTMTLTNPQLTVLNTSTAPPSPQAVTAQFANNSTTETLTVNVSPALTIASNLTSGVTMDFNLRKSVQVNGTGQVTGTVDPQLTMTPATVSGTMVGEADTLSGVVQSVTTTSTNSAFTGSFTIQVHGGVGQVMTVQVDGSTDFEGDGVTGLSTLATGTFVEVDSIVDTSGNIVAQEVDAEEQVSAATQRSAFLGQILSVTRDGSGNATALDLFVEDEIPDLSGEAPTHSALTISLQSTTKYLTNWRRWNPKVFTLTPQTIGVAQKIAVHGVLGSGTSPTLTAREVFLRPRNVMGNFTSLLTAGSDNKTGGFTIVPCGALFGGKPITVLTFANSNFRGVSGLTALTPAPTLNTFGVLFYEQSNGTSSQPTWTAPTWVMQAKGVHQLPN